MEKNNSLPQNRNFGFLFCLCFCVLSVYAAYHNADAFKVYGLLIAGLAVGLIAVVTPSILAPLNIVWIKLGELMGKVVNPLVLGVIFFVLLTPVALITKLFGRDELRLKRINVHSYWIERTPPGPTSNSFKNQF